jgi:hypothetical protein
MMLFFIVGLLGLLAVLWYLLERHENRRAIAGKPRHSSLRLVFAAVALLLLLFSGGCSLLFLVDMSRSSGSYVTWEAVAVLGGTPFVVGLVVWWLAMRRSKAGPPVE